MSAKADVGSREYDDALDALGERIATGVVCGDSAAEIWRMVLEEPAYHGRLRISVFRLLESRGRRGNSDLADDLASEATVMLTASFAAKTEFPWQPHGKFSHWLSTVIANACSNAWKRVTRGKDEQLAPDLAAALPAVAPPKFDATQPELWARVIEAIVLIPQPHQSFLSLWLIEGEDQKKIAQKLKRSESSISQLKHKSLQILRQHLGLDDEEDTP